MSSRFRVILVIGICLIILSIVGGILWWWPMTSSYMELKQELDSKDKELAEKREYFTELSNTLSRVKGYEEELAKIESAFPKDPDIAVPNLFNFMRETSSENGLVLRGVTGDIKSLRAGESGIEELPFTVSVNGSYPDFKNFLSALYRNVRMIDVEGLQFGSAESAGSLFNFSVSLVTYMDTGSFGQSEREETEAGKSSRER